jgi:MHS family alpha-ketoglutarate permease-like MFS transporter
VALMSLGSFAIALIPSYAAIGVFAPIALTAARIVQGLSIGGEYGAGATYLSEMAGRRRRGFWSSFQFVTLIMGQLAATLVLVVLQHTLTKGQLEDWGWRVPFAIGGVLAVVVFWIRSNLEETTAFTRVQAADRPRLDPAHMRSVLILLAVALCACAALFAARNPNAMTLSVAILVVWQLSLAAPLVRRHPREVLMVAGLTAAGSMSFYAYTTYLPKFLVNTAGLGKDTATAISAGSLMIYMLVQPLAGHLSDRFGRRTMMSATFLLGAVLTYPIMTQLSHVTSAWLAFGLATALCLIHTGYSSVSAVVKAELFPTAIRAMGVALPYAIANTVFGGTAEYVALWFKTQRIESGFYIYVSVMMSIALAISLRIRNTNLTSLIEED